MSTTTTSAAISALGHGHPVRVRDALEAGITRSAIRAALAAGTLIRVRHGCLLSFHDQSTHTRDQVIDRIHAACSRLKEEAIVSHASAALIHGLPLPYGSTIDQIHLTSLAGSRRRYPGVTIHAARGLADTDIVTLHGLHTTSVMRTAVDVARGRPLAEALIPLDAAVRRLVIEHPDQRPESPDHERVEVGEIVSAVVESLAVRGNRLVRCGGVRELRRAIEYVSPLAESPLESGSRGTFIDRGLIPLSLQHRFVDATGTERRADFLLGTGIIGEADGLIKYEGVEGAKRLRAEKLRDLACAEVGLRTIRWTATDVWVRPNELLRRIRREIAAFAGRPSGGPMILDAG